MFMLNLRYTDVLKFSIHLRLFTMKIFPQFSMLRTQKVKFMSTIICDVATGRHPFIMHPRVFSIDQTLAKPYFFNWRLRVSHTIQPVPPLHCTQLSLDCAPLIFCPPHQLAHFISIPQDGHLKIYGSDVPLNNSTFHIWVLFCPAKLLA